MPVTVVNIVYDVPGGNGSERRVLYRGQTTSGGTIDYGPVCTVDPSYNAEGYINAVVREQMNYNLAEMELIQTLPA